MPADASGAPAVLATTDGWNTWSVEDLPTDVGIPMAISCPDPSHCWVVGFTLVTSGSSPVAASVAATSDGGSTWNVETAPSGTGLLDSVSCTSDTSCFADGMGVTVFASKEAIAPVVIDTADGVSWAADSLPLSSGELLGISCASASSCVAVGSAGSGASLVLVTTDGGGTWTDQTNGLNNGTGPLKGVACAGASDCWAVGSDPNDTAGQVLGSTDGGASWQAESLPSGTPPLSTISCPSSSDCWAASGGSGLLSILAGTGLSSPSVVATQDGGSAWATQSLPSGVDAVDSIGCPTSTTCWATGSAYANFETLSLAGVTVPSTTTTNPTSSTTSTTSLSTASTTTAPSSTDSSTQSSGSTTTSSVPTAVSSSGYGVVSQSSGQLAFTGSGRVIDLIAAVGAVLVILGALLFLTTGTVGTRLRRLALLSFTARTRHIGDSAVARPHNERRKQILP